MYLDYAENQANRGRLMSMRDWTEKLDAFLIFNDYDILKNVGRISADVVKKFAENEYEKFRITQDKEYKSDFDKVIEGIKNTGALPKESDSISINPLSIKSISKLSELNQNLKKGLNYNPKENE